jgi:kynurenine formamidase
MNRIPVMMNRLLCTAALVGGLAAAPSAVAQAYNPYPGPSPWGPGDEAGNSNTQTPARVLAAKKLIKRGKVYSLGHVYESSMPMFPGNYGLGFDVKPVQHLSRQIVNTEMLHGEITQMGTQFDALGHFAILAPGSDSLADALYYNQFVGGQVLGPQGLEHLGVEKVKPFVTRGVLLDIQRYANGGQMMVPGQEVTLAMVRRTLAAQHMTEADIGEGDVVLFVTGWEAMWNSPDNGYYLTPGLGLAAPGLGLEVAMWLSSKRVACVGADNWGLEVSPPKPPATPEVLFPIHHQLLVKGGVFMHESLKLHELADDLAGEHAGRPDAGRGSYEFFYVYNPVAFKGASGAPGAPLVIR